MVEEDILVPDEVVADEDEVVEADAEEVEEDEGEGTTLSSVLPSIMKPGEMNW